MAAANNISISSRHIFFSAGDDALRNACLSKRRYSLSRISQPKKLGETNPEYFASKPFNQRAADRARRSLEANDEANAGRFARAASIKDKMRSAFPGTQAKSG